MRADDFAAKFLKVTEGGTYLHRECGRAAARLRLSGVLGVRRPPDTQARLVCPRRARHLVGGP
jgi:hypothetical protein